MRCLMSTSYKKDQDQHSPATCLKFTEDDAQQNQFNGDLITQHCSSWILGAIDSLSDFFKRIPNFLSKGK